MKPDAIAQYETLRDVPLPKGHVYLYAPKGAGDVYKRLCTVAVDVQPVDDDPLSATEGHRLVAVGDNTVLRQAKRWAARYRIPLTCLATDMACVEGLNDYVVTLSPSPEVKRITMQTAFVDELNEGRNALADLYAYLFGRYVMAFDTRLMALWQNRSDASWERTAATLRHALLSCEIYRDEKAMWTLAQETANDTSLTIDRYAGLIDLSCNTPPKSPFAAAVAIAEALRLAPNLPPIALPPDRKIVVQRLADLGIALVPQALDPAEMLRRDWIWMSLRPAMADYFDLTDRVCAIHRSLSPDCGYREMQTLDGWDLLELLPLAAELCYDTSALGYMYALGVLNTWIA